MNFWKEKFGNNIYNLEYEKITENPEEETKKLLDFCETGWDENCLFFYKNKKTVSTASLAQVRNPIYKTSVKKWEKYSEDIELLKNLLKKNIN